MAKTIKSHYDNVPVTKATLSGMSWNPYDQLFLKRMLDLQDTMTERFISDTYDLHAQIIIDTVREMLEINKKEIFVVLNELRSDIKELRSDIKELKADVKGINIEMEKLKIKVDGLITDVGNHGKRIDQIEKHLSL